jgi:oligoribonuclease NrnB/cAMP/cGMP phosphodiesterase (DHH superfamily)
MKTVLYHKNCSDGMMSAVLLSVHYAETNQEATYVAVNYNEPMPEVAGTEVVIVDFSYPPEVLEAASKIATSITMLDHHLTAANQWGGYKRFTHRCFDGTGCEMHLTLKEERSGAGLTWDYIQEQLGETDSMYFKESPGSIWIDGKLKRVMLAVEDKDLWKFSLPDTKVIGEALRALPLTIEAWTSFILHSAPSEFNEALLTAETILATKERQAQGLAKKATVKELRGIPFPIPVVNCPAEFTSRVGEILYAEHPAALMWASDGISAFCSFRSNQVDVSSFAAQFGGGGHAAAAGFRLPLVEFALWLTDRLTYP